MTTFSKNPYAEARKKVNHFLFKIGLSNTLDAKFKHKKFSERFALANTSFIGMGAIAQFASLVTAFTMLSYLFVGIHLLIRMVCSAALVLMIEAVKRDSINDVMKGIFQYKEVERFPAILALITIVSSIYISVEGSKILPSLLVPDAVMVSPTLATADSITIDFQQRIKDKENERNNYRKSRLWKGRLARKDSKVIEQYNLDIQDLQTQKDDALKSLEEKNDKAAIKAQNTFDNAALDVKQQRAKLGDQLVIAAIGFEVLFLLSMCFSWWYYTECEKERKHILETSKVTAELPTNPSVETSKVHEDTSKVTAETSKVQPDNGDARSQRKIGFKDYEQTAEVTAAPAINTAVNTSKVMEETLEVEKEYTRICPECETPFIHKTHNHKYCKRACMLAARARRKDK